MTANFIDNIFRRPGIARRVFVSIFNNSLFTNNVNLTVNINNNYYYLNKPSSNNVTLQNADLNNIHDLRKIGFEVLHEDEIKNS